MSIVLGIIVSASVIALITLAGFGIADGNAPKSYQATTCAKTIIYGENINVDDFTLKSKTKYFHIKRELEIKYEMLQYDRELIGDQTAYLSYKDIKKSFDLTINPKKLDAPTIEFENNKLKWTANELTNSYQLKVGETVYTLKDMDLTEIELDTYITNYDVKSISLRAYSEEAKYSPSDYSNILQLRKTPEATNLTYDKVTQTFSWNGDPNISTYKVFINNFTYVTHDTNFKFGQFIPGNNSVRIQSYGSENFVGSDLVALNIQKLKAPSNIYYDTNTNVLSWDNIPNANSYEVKINDKSYTCESNSYSINLDANTAYKIKVKALTNNNLTIDSDYSTEVDFKIGKLMKPEVTVEDSAYKNEYVLHVNTVANADKYLINIKKYKGSNLFTEYDRILTDSFDCNVSLEDDVTKIVASVQAIEEQDEYYDSDITTLEFGPKVLTTPVITLKDNVLSWEDDVNATSYNVFINGTVVSTEESSMDIASYIESNHSLTLKVQAISNDNRYINSAISKELLIGKLDKV